jgi:hypothetical protein
MKRVSQELMGVGREAKLKYRENAWLGKKKARFK